MRYRDRCSSLNLQRLHRGGRNSPECPLRSHRLSFLGLFQEASCLTLLALLRDRSSFRQQILCGPDTRNPCLQQGSNSSH